jgi:tubulin polyglutamylase TTLL2
MEDLQYDHHSVLQKYIHNPLLIKGMKWDMRIYVAIPKTRPMKIHLYNEGLVRFSTERYDKAKLTNLFSHLTNSSINKYAHGGGQDGAKVHDNKWTIDQLKSHFCGSGFDYEGMWMKIEKIIILTCINMCSICPNIDNAFELMGFDIMIDSQLKPWLLEVNSSPAMSMDGAADQRVKPELLRDTFKLIDFEPYDVYNERMA